MPISTSVDIAKSGEVVMAIATDKQTPRISERDDDDDRDGRSVIDFVRCDSSVNSCETEEEIDVEHDFDEGDGGDIDGSGPIFDDTSAGPNDGPESSIYYLSEESSDEYSEFQEDEGSSDGGDDSGPDGGGDSSSNDEQDEGSSDGGDDSGPDGGGDSSSNDEQDEGSSDGGDDSGPDGGGDSSSSDGGDDSGGDE